jgi:hypothetical protein
MIHKTLKFLTEQINVYVDQVKKPDDGVVSPIVVLQNISHLDEKMLKTTNKILLSLVNIEVVPPYKNISHNPSINIDQEKNNIPPLTLKLFILITAIMGDYENALIYLSHIITFLNNKPIFTQQDCRTKVKGLPKNFKIMLDLFSLTIEQSNGLWSALGGKQLPFICYQVRGVSL